MNLDAISNMLEMQHRMNTRVHEQWIDQGFEWYRAVWIECGELMDHVGYKWWKKQVPDMEQVRLEVVDIWHFGMSALFKPGNTVEALAQEIASAWVEQEAQDNDAEMDVGRVHAATESLAQDALASKSFSVPLFAELMRACSLTPEQLYRHYVGKNVLNFSGRTTGIKKALM